MNALIEQKGQNNIQVSFQEKLYDHKMKLNSNDLEPSREWTILQYRDNFKEMDLILLCDCISNSMASNGSWLYPP